MKMVVYAVHDVVADTWSFPQVSPTRSSVERDFLAFRLRPNVPGSDLECCVLGSFDPSNGQLVSSDPVVLVKADRKEPNEV